MPPIIGITTQREQAKTAAGDIDSHMLPHTYTDSVQRAGGIPLLLAPVPRASLPLLLDRLDGLVLSGGGDIEAHNYGADSHEMMQRMDFDRDVFEIELVRHAVARKMPTLAICRGLQIVNVACGGTLIQDIPSQIGSMDHTVIGHAVYDGHQPVRLEPTCRVAAAVGSADLMVNSIHHQAVAQLAPGFRAVGWAADGVIEAIEHDDPSWPLLAVQWHPEYLGHKDDAASHSLFDALVEAAGTPTETQLSTG